MTSKMIKMLLFILTISLISVNKNKVEAVFEASFSENNINNLGSNNIQDAVEKIERDDARKGRNFYSHPPNPVINMMLQSGAQNYVSKHNGDFFDFLRDSYTLPRGQKSPLAEYDFIVIGAGSAGCTLASRLTEDKNTSVLLLEAGRPEMLLTDIPALAPYFQATDYTWQYYMEHQPGVCMGMKNKRCFWPRGKAVGGTSVINYMIYTRGRPQDWDRIAADGNYGWSYNEVLQYYMKSEKANLKGYDQKPYRNKEGELPVQFVPVKTKLLSAFLEAGKLLGHPTVDYNAPDGFGFGKVQVTINNGRRQSAAKVFLDKHKYRQNLNVLPEATVTKILIDQQTKTANGVEYVRNSQKYKALARKEVIVSAGPIASPQLLMLSGVGPREHLLSKGIAVLKDLPVGRTLYDHICFPGLIFELNTTGISFDENAALSLRNAANWLRDGQGPFTTPGAVEGIGYIKTSVSDDPELVPDIELISIGGSITADAGIGGSQAVRRGMRITDEVFNEGFGSIFNKDTWSSFPMLLHPKSVGYLELRDNNPFSFPHMYGNYLSEKSDVASFVAAIRHIQALVATEPFQRFGAKVYPAQYRYCSHLQFDSDEYWECAVRMLTATLHHQIATCRMGPAGDPKAVVDPELRVHGVNRLRVVDSSVIPRTISAHTNAPAIMIGEKATDMIKNTWNL